MVHPPGTPGTLYTRYSRYSRYSLVFPAQRASGLNGRPVEPRGPLARGWATPRANGPLGSMGLAGYGNTREYTGTHGNTGITRNTREYTGIRVLHGIHGIQALRALLTRYGPTGLTNQIRPYGPYYQIRPYGP